jgi:TrwC relaxase
MLTISKALSAGQAQAYHSREFASEEQNYWSQDRRAHSEWRGALAEEWELKGSVGASHFARLSEGQHPGTGEEIVKHQPTRTYENDYRRQITSAEHRAGWHITEQPLKYRKCDARDFGSLGFSKLVRLP